MKAACVLAATALLACACSKPAPPEKERPVEPQSRAGLAGTLHAPIEKAKGVQQAAERDAEATRKAVDDAGG